MQFIYYLEAIYSDKTSHFNYETKRRQHIRQFYSSLLNDFRYEEKKIELN